MVPCASGLAFSANLLWRSRELDQDRGQGLLYWHTTEHFLQTTVLQLRPKTEINVRIFVDPMKPPAHVEREKEIAVKMEASIIGFQAQLGSGMMFDRGSAPTE
ncbi:hypothetical protein PMIN07_008500 [Paraphaeosphaeria minitans]